MTNHPASPFFIVGTGRCGSTILRKLIDRHPLVYIPRETHWLPIAWHEFGAERVPHDAMLHVVENVFMARGSSALDRIMEKEELDYPFFRTSLLHRLPTDGRCSIAEFQSTFYALLAERHGRSICGDKTPDYGMCMTTIQTLWPDARFVHIARDGRDVALSMTGVLSFRCLVAWQIDHWWSIAWRKAYETRLGEAERDLPLDGFYRLWRRRIVRTRDESTRLRPGSYLEVGYESLLREPERVLADIGRFLELPADDDWIGVAAARVRRDNANKNAERAEYLALSERYAADLASLGFDTLTARR